MAALAPAMAEPFRFHCQVRGPVPDAEAVKVAVWPAVTARLAGWVVMAGATGAGFTVKVATGLVTLPTALPTRTANVEPLSESCVVERV